VAAAIVYRLRTPAPQPLAPPVAAGGAATAGDRQAAGGAGGAGATAGASGGSAAVPGDAQQSGGTAGTSADVSSSAGNGAGGGAALGAGANAGAAGGTPALSPRRGRVRRAAQPGASAQSASPGTAAAPAAPAASADAEGAAARQQQAGGEAPTGDGGDAEERVGGLPAVELRRLANELQREGEYLHNLYETKLSRREQAGTGPTSGEEHLAGELKDLAGAAERFALPFQTGLFARTRARLGRITRGEDERAHILRLARDLTGRGAEVEPLMQGAKLDPAVRMLWTTMRRQLNRVAEICGA
jgi:hypothetical protein